MLPQIPLEIAARLAMKPQLAFLILAFFVYSFAGYIMECIVLTIDHRKLVVNRGFVNHLPFCIIYGFGAMFGYAVLGPFKDNMVLLFVMSAVLATSFEYMVGRMQQRLFGNFWWDYSKKPLNYKGIICLESTLGWGVIGVFVIRYFHGVVVGLVQQVPADVASLVAIGLVLLYLVDFTLSARVAKQKQKPAVEPDALQQVEPVWETEQSK